MKRMLVGAVALLAGSLVAAATMHAQIFTPLPPVTTPTTIIGTKTGQTFVIATYLNANGKVVVDTVSITVVPVAVATVGLLNVFSPPGWTSSATIGKPFCAYAVARDSAGNVLTGRPVVFAIADTSIAKLTLSPVCPDTSIDPSKMTVNPLPPLQVSLHRKR